MEHDTSLCGGLRPSHRAAVEAVLERKNFRVIFFPSVRSSKA